VDRKIGRAYGAADDPNAPYAKRVSCLIDEQGRVLKYYPQVAPRDHVAEVLRDITG
jgi:peroxiredoxin